MFVGGDYRFSIWNFVGLNIRWEIYLTIFSENLVDTYFWVLYDVTDFGGGYDVTDFGGG